MQRICLSFKSSMTSLGVHSDTLFGALCWGYRHIYGKESIETLLEKFDSGKPPFILSSGFPWLEYRGEKTYFYPKPHIKFEFMDKGYNIKAQAIFNKLKYIPEDLFMALTEGILSTEKIAFRRYSVGKKKEWGFNALDRDYIMGRDAVFPREVAEGLRLDGFYKRAEVPGNAINRLTMATDENLYFREEVFLREESGIFFLLNASSNVVDGLRASMNYLEDRGIGGEISTGKGQFNVISMKDFKGFERPQDAFVTLSLYCPTSDEISGFNEDNTWYEPVVRKGKIESAFVKRRNPWKDKLLMFSEGSIFPTSEERYYGHCPIVREEPHTIRQYGLAFPVQFKVIKNET